MSENKCFEKSIEIKGSSFYNIPGIIFIVMAIIGFQQLLDSEPSDMIGCIVGLAWILVVLCLSACSFLEANKKVILCKDGIYSHTLRSKRFLGWDEVKDWGLSYAGNSRGGGKIFYLYFSKNIFRIKNARKKKLKGKMIKIEIFEAEYSKILNNVIPYCKDKTCVEPFVGEL